MDGDFTQAERDGLYKAVFTRRDVRSRFTGEGISDEKLARILNAAHHAPSVGFSQPWNFIMIKSGETKEAIKGSFDRELARSSELIKDPRRSQYLSFKLEGIMEAPVNICITYDPTRFGPFVIGRSSIPETGIYSVCCAVQNLWLAARAEGIGLGWVSILSNSTLRRVLKMPEHVVPVAYLCLGHVEGFAARPDLETVGWLPRLGLGEVVNYEKWERGDDPGWAGVRRLICPEGGGG